MLPICLLSGKTYFHPQVNLCPPQFPTVKLLFHPLKQYVGGRYLFFNKKKLIWERGRNKERETLTCSTYSCIYWLIFTSALTQDQIQNLGISRRFLNPGSYPLVG